MIIVLAIAGFVLLVTIFFKQEIESSKEKDPAAKSFIEIVLLYPGLHAIIAYRIAHGLFKKKIPIIPDIISKVARFFTGIEIHPAAQIGRGCFVDHGMGVVIGETSIIGENVTLFQGVTLGGTGKETGKRHPTLGDNIVVGAGAKILGNITIGSNSYVGANAVVLQSVPENTTVVGVPGKVTKQDGKKIDKMMDHIHVLDPVMQKMEELQERIDSLESKLKGKDGGK
ncbi:MAG: serine O-acetyltransferase [Candidatus Omnitrophica bacterium]|nr:serine O-acetyltransferase [Candidatus Omnitrophota bacterium]MBU1997789.1 serine O-acetyltransferase [Candidatus Omnitrophota bacterium]